MCATSRGPPSKMQWASCKLGSVKGICSLVLNLVFFRSLVPEEGRICKKRKPSPSPSHHHRTEYFVVLAEYAQNFRDYE
jgi:hypothetical protein